MLIDILQEIVKENLTSTLERFSQDPNDEEAIKLTKRDYKMILKRFYKWFRNCEDEFPPEVRWIKLRNNIQNGLQKKDLLTVKEIESLANCARHPRDKAFIWVYFESMRRLGEILTLNIGDVEFDELGARLRVDGKAGRDYGRIIFSVPVLSAWLNIHPLRDYPNAPLWVTLNGGYKRLSYPAARTMLKECAERAGIKKRVWLYLIRHSRITPASKILPHALLCSTAGWKQGSKMPSVYIHLAGEDIDEAHCMLSGIGEIKKKEDERIVPIKCQRCNTDNTPGSKFCNICGSPLSMKVALELDEVRKKADRLMSELLKRPEILEVLLNALEDLKY